MKQTIIEWVTKYDYSGPDEMKYKLNQLIEDGFTIVQVIPTEYTREGRIQKAIIIYTEPAYGKA
jgi:hypothetical protein